MEVFEEAVLAYISAAPGRFVKPQYDIKYKDGVGGSCPDFVVIDYIKKTIYVVEVTTASDASCESACNNDPPLAVIGIEN